MPTRHPSYPEAGHASAWTPILHGAQARAAELAISEIARDLRRVASDPGIWAAREPLYADSLFSGRAGVALFFAYLARVRGDEAAARLAEELFEQSVDAMATAEWMDASLFQGVAGIAWLHGHIHGFDPDDDSTEDVDELLLEHLSAPSTAVERDLIRGVVGIGVYALERLPDARARRLAERAVEVLADTAESSVRGISWSTEETRDKVGKVRVHDLGMAHGIAGVIGFLARAVAADVAGRQAERLLRGALAWLRGQRRGSGVVRYPTRVLASGEALAGTGRHAWCYGDPGIAVALWAASRVLDDSECAAEALDLMRCTAMVSVEEARVIDPGVCHGTAGLGHMLMRMMHLSGDEHFASGARRWLQHTLDMRRPDNRMGGVWAISPEVQAHAPASGPQPGFLYGAAGVGLVLLAATSSVEPSWDRALLLGTAHEP